MYSLRFKMIKFVLKTKKIEKHEINIKISLL